MQVIYCANPLEPTQPDDLYAEESKAATQLGIQSGLINFEKLVYENNPDAAVRRAKPSIELTELAVYRGWMMTPAKYTQLFDALHRKGLDLINSPDSYKHCHYLPEWYELLANCTPKAAWIAAENLGDNQLTIIMEKLQAFGSGPIILKDYVKSAKHHWKEACFIPNASDRNHVDKVVSRFLEIRGDELEGGLVFRQFINFKALTTHSKSGMPLTKEFRLFVLDGKIVHWFNYWEEGNYENMVPPLELFADRAKHIKSRFFTMDIAQAETDEWLVVELGDGQVAGLPENASAKAFYESLNLAM